MSELRTRRLNMGLTLAELADKVGVSEGVIQYAETTGRPRPATALTIATFFGVSVTELWPLDSEKTAA